VVYIDFRKAFDKVPHGRLVQKVRSHGIQHKLANWIQNWQRVMVESCFCDWKPVTSGVPQGSVLFVVYINDLEVNVEGIISKVCR